MEHHQQQSVAAAAAAALSLCTICMPLGQTCLHACISSIGFVLMPCQSQLAATAPARGIPVGLWGITVGLWGIPIGP